MDTQTFVPSDTRLSLTLSDGRKFAGMAESSSAVGLVLLSEQPSAYGPGTVTVRRTFVPWSAVAAVEWDQDAPA